MLSVRGRRSRAAVTVVVLALVLAGSLWGEDDDFPFGPFKMYALPTSESSVVVTAWVEAVDAAGRVVRIGPDALGMRPAELEGQFPHLGSDPSLLGAVADAHRRRHPDDPPLVDVRLMERRRELAGGRIVTETTDAVARWAP